jgi:hypothetical protein
MLSRCGMLTEAKVGRPRILRTVGWLSLLDLLILWPMVLKVI